MKRRTIIGVLSACVAFGSIGCGPGAPKAKTASVEPGAMPSDGDWEGVWYSPLYGHLHMKPDGNLVNARWQRPLKGRWGELQGNADGNLLRFDWTEYVDGLVGPNSKKSGKGYFVYLRPEGDNVDDVIEGEIGRGEDEVGDAWRAVKQRNVKQDIESVGGVGASEIGGGDWDGDNKEPDQEPEEPVEPDVDAPEL